MNERRSEVLRRARERAREGEELTPQEQQIVESMRSRNSRLAADRGQQQAMEQRGLIPQIQHLETNAEQQTQPVPENILQQIQGMRESQQDINRMNNIR